MASLSDTKRTAATQEPVAEAETQAALDAVIREKTIVVNKIIAVEAKKVLASLSQEEAGPEDWNGIISAGPKSLISIALCYIASSANAELGSLVQGSNPDLPKDLKTNITACYDQGLDAFKEAERGMTEVALKIKDMLEPYGILDELLDHIKEIKGLNDDLNKRNAEISELNDCLGELQKAAHECATSTGEVVEKFEVWMKRCRQVHLAFTEVQEQEKVKQEKKSAWSEGIRQLFGLYRRKKSGLTTPPDAHDDQNHVLASVLKDATKVLPHPGSVIGLQANWDLAAKHDITMVLQLCLGNLAEIKARLEELSSFFSRLQTEISHLANNKVSSLAALASNPKSLDTRKTKKIHILTLQLRINYHLAWAKAQIYANASRRHIAPGVRLVTELGNVTDATVQDQIRRVVEYSKETLKEIGALTKGEVLRAPRINVITSGPKD